MADGITEPRRINGRLAISSQEVPVERARPSVRPGTLILARWVFAKALTILIKLILVAAGSEAHSGNARIAATKPAIHRRWNFRMVLYSRRRWLVSMAVKVEQ